jgi:glycosyltransferase involved in cell wall biosynthesis
VTGLGGPFRRGWRSGTTDGFTVREYDIACGNAQGLRARSRAFLRFAAAATTLAIGGGWDVVVASSTPLTVAIPALAARRLRGTPFVFEIRDPWPELPRALSTEGGVPGPALRAMGRLADAACRRAAAVVALTEGIAETAVARGADPARVAVLPQGADLSLFGPGVPPWRPPEVPAGEVLAVYAGAHGRANGLDTLLDAARALRGSGIRLLLVGEGGEKPRLLARAAAEELPVTFLDPLPKPRLAALLAGADLGLLCLAPVADFAEWTAPNKLSEGLAAGLPMVVNVPGRAARLVAGGGCGLAVPPGDAMALAGAPAHSRRRSRAARADGRGRPRAGGAGARCARRGAADGDGGGGRLGRRGGPPGVTSPDVLMLSAAHPPEDVRIVQKEGAALSAAGFRVAHLAPGEDGPRRAHGVEILPFPAAPGWRRRILGIPALARRAAALRPRVIQAHEPDSWLAGWLAARRCGARLVLDVHEHYPSRLDALLPRPLRPLGRTALRLACRLMGAAAAAVVVAKDGLDAGFGGAARCTKVRNYATPLPVAPRAHGPGPLRLVHLGALGRGRGAFTMLDTLALLPHGTRLVLVGRFTDGSEAAFRARAAVLGLADRVETHGWMERAAAVAIAARCDLALVLFQPGVENHRLALPHKLFDAMLAGLPVVVPDFAEEVAAVVREAGCGIATDVADPRRVAEGRRRPLRPRDPRGDGRARAGGGARPLRLGGGGGAPGRAPSPPRRVLARTRVDPDLRRPERSRRGGCDDGEWAGAAVPPRPAAGCGAARGGAGAGIAALAVGLRRRRGGGQPRAGVGPLRWHPLLQPRRRRAAELPPARPLAADGTAGGLARCLPEPLRAGPPAAPGRGTGAARQLRRALDLPDPGRGPQHPDRPGLVGPRQPALLRRAAARERPRHRLRRPAADRCRAGLPRALRPPGRCDARPALAARPAAHAGAARQRGGDPGGGAGHRRDDGRLGADGRARQRGSRRRWRRSTTGRRAGSRTGTRRSGRASC